MNTARTFLAVMALAVFMPSCAHAQRTLIAGSSHWGRFFNLVDTPNQTMSVWIRMPATNVASTFIVATRGPVADNHYRALGYGVGFFYVSSRAGVSGYNSQSNALPLPNTWIHVAGVFAGAASRTVYVNGVAAATETTSVTPTSVDEVNWGRLTTSAGNYYCSADMVEPAVWSTNLTSIEIVQLAAGGSFASRAHPAKIRPDKLVWLPDLTIPGAAVPGVGGVTGISNSPALLTVLPPAFR